MQKGCRNELNNSPSRTGTRERLVRCPGRKIFEALTLRVLSALGTCMGFTGQYTNNQGVTGHSTEKELSIFLICFYQQFSWRQDQAPSHRGHPLGTFQEQ